MFRLAVYIYVSSGLDESETYEFRTRYDKRSEEKKHSKMSQMPCTVHDCDK